MKSVPLTKRKVAQYTLLPEFIPRIIALFHSGFHHISYMIAVIFQMTGLLPQTHPYLNPANIGHYGLRHVMGEAYSRLIFKKQHIDQIAIFFTVSIGLVVLCVQFALIVIMLIGGDVMAAPNTALQLIPWTDWFTIGGGSGISSPAEQDMAMMTLDRVFGVKNIFNSCISTGAECHTYQNVPIAKSSSYPYPMHIALHKMFEFYSYGIVFVGVIVILYYITTIVAETAQTGSPFGQRYSKAWAPVRLILFFALITPLNIGGVNAGLNSAQIVTLYTAKFGSNMASNAWGFFGSRINHEYIKDKQELIAENNIPQMGNLAQFVFVAKTCALMMKLHHGVNINPYIIVPLTLVYTEGNIDVATGDAVIMTERGDNTDDDEEFIGTSFSRALETVKNGTIIVRFGEFSRENHPTETSFVSRECGEIKFQVTDVNEPGSIKVQSAYYDLLKKMWTDSVFDKAATCLINKKLPIGDINCTEWPSQTTMDNINENYNAEIAENIKEGLEEQIQGGDYKVTETLKEKGWAVAAVWFNKIAQMNGAVTTAVFNIPRAHSWPRVLEEALKQKRKADAHIDQLTRFSPFLAGRDQVEFTRYGDRKMALILNTAFTDWEKGASIDSVVSPTGNIAIDTINAIMGTSGLFEMRTKNADLHPLAQISALGKGLIEATMRNIVAAGALKAGRGALSLLGSFPAAEGMAQAAGGFLFSIAMTTIVIGAILFYVVPFLPFIYFLFAVSGWIKSIFEAIVAMPIWALAHLRIDGEGLPGPAASNGYFLLLDILIRPTLIVVGLIASISIFSALVKVLNEIFDLIVSNTGGYDTAGTLTATDAAFYRSPLDQLMFTVIYAVLVYMMALSSFKLIDHIPNQILRWAGSSVKTFQEDAGDPAGQLSGQIWKGGTIMKGGLQGGTLGALIAS